MFDHRLVIVTGGTGALGGAVVATLLEAGARVWLPFQRPGELASLQERLGLREGAALDGSVLDLSDEQAVEAGYARAIEHYGAPLGLVNIAGGFDGGAPIHATPWSLWQQQLDINLKTLVLSCRAAVPHMLQGGGAIVNISSRTATQSGKNVAAYAAAKRAVLQVTEALAAELLAHDIRANALLPSVIDTPANRAANPEADYDAWVKPGAIARVVLFLLGPDAAPISGAAIPVYGKA
jgi:NAD(P)-dependent dehydrogenase (short-subunit alcohol dehydrogenase family)